MSTLDLLDRVYRARLAVLALAVAAVYATVRTTALPSFAIWTQLTSIGEAVYVLCFGATAAAAILALPRAEAAEVTASRPQWAVRLLVAGGLYLAFVPVAALVCVAAGSAWFLAPLLRVAVVTAAVTFALSTVLPSGYVALGAVVYVLFCAYATDEVLWWNLVFSDPSWANGLAAVVVGALGTAVYAALGARPLAPEEEY